VNSRRKGVRGELEWAEFLRNQGIDARRGQQYSGSPGSPDVFSSVDEVIHWEVKRVEHLNLDKAMLKARGDAGDGRIPVVAHRKNNGEWLVSLPADAFLLFVKFCVSDKMVGEKL